MTDNERLRERVAELKATVAALETALNRDLPLLKGTVRAMVGADSTSLVSFPTQGDRSNGWLRHRRSG